MTQRADTERRYCSRENAAESLWGTADVVDVWVLLEYSATWKPKPLDENDLADQTNAWLSDTLQKLASIDLRGRVQFIRRPELDQGETRLLIGLHDQLFQFSGLGYDFLATLDIVHLVQHPDVYESLTEPRYFVCTNGQRDVCCARYGLPVYHELRSALGERVWQTTHLGGHRFAANVLVLPGGLLHGRVTTDELSDLIPTWEDGGISFKHLRGRSQYPKHVQAAEAALGQEGLRFVSLEGDEEDALVTFASAAQSHTVHVYKTSEPLALQKSCGKEPEDVQSYVSLVQ
jgi:hypothetical protein